MHGTRSRVLAVGSLGRHDYLLSFQRYLHAAPYFRECLPPFVSDTSAMSNSKSDLSPMQHKEIRSHSIPTEISELRTRSSCCPQPGVPCVMNLQKGRCSERARHGHTCNSQMIWIEHEGSESPRKSSGPLGRSGRGSRCVGANVNGTSSPYS